MSIIIDGDMVSRGICLGKAIVVHKDKINYSPSYIKNTNIKKEVSNFKSALDNVLREYNNARDKVKDNRAVYKLMDTQIVFINDESFFKSIVSKITDQLYTAHWAVSSEYISIKESFESIEDKYIKERLIDIKQMIMSILDSLNKTNNQNKFLDSNIRGKILVTSELTPKDVLDIHNKKVLGVITTHGSSTSHSSILSRSLSLPLIVNAEASENIIKNDDFVILDSDNEKIIINPEKIEVNHYKKLKSIKTAENKNLKRILQENNETLDKVKINIMSNLELSEELKTLNIKHFDGVGLFRTEYLYVDRNDLPTEDEQLKSYKQVLKKLKNNIVTLRTLDIGSDKEVPDNIQIGTIAKNPALGLRGIRYSLSERNIFITQIKAMLRAGMYGKLRILIPMVTNINEILKTKELINEAIDLLKKEKKRFSKDYELGIMIEVPSTAIQASSLAKYVDFMSIGTNDLVQYILATDRIDDEVGSLYDSTDPSVLVLIKKVIDAGKKFNKDVTVCGEIAGDVKYTKLLLGLGLRSFSMHPRAIPEIKKVIISSDISIIKKKISKILNTFDSTEREKLISSL